MSTCLQLFKSHNFCFKYYIQAKALRSSVQFQLSSKCNLLLVYSIFSWFAQNAVVVIVDRYSDFSSFSSALKPLTTMSHLCMLHTTYTTLLKPVSVVLSEPWSVHGLPDVHPESGSSQHGSGQGLFGAYDQAAGAGPGLHGHPGSAHPKRGGKGQGEDQEAVRDRAQQAPRLGKHHGTLSFK